MNTEIRTDLIFGKGTNADFPLIRKLNYIHQMTCEEMAALIGMHECPMIIDERKIFLTQGDVHQKSFIITQGWAYRFSDLADGNRQVINFYLPGDIISPFALVMPRTNYSVATITKLQVCAFDPEHLIKLFVDHPKIGLFYGWMLGREDSSVADQVVRIGRRSAYKRTAHLLLELFHRLKVIGRTHDKSFVMPLTQQLLADTLGLSFVHMNRTLHKLRKDGLINIESNTINLLDIDKLMQIAEYQTYYLDQLKQLSSTVEQVVDKVIEEQASSAA